MPTEPPSWANVFIPHLDTWSVLPVLGALALVGYLVAVARVRRSGIAWPWWRTAAWTAGTVSLFAVTGTWLQGYGMALFSLHMVRHMALSMVPPLLLLGAPLTLALRTLPCGTGAAGDPRAPLFDVLRSRATEARNSLPEPRTSGVNQVSEC